MTITLSTDPIVAVASIPVAIAHLAYEQRKETRRRKKYEKMIARSQAHLASIPVAQSNAKI